MDADAAYRKRHGGDTTSLLKPDDRALFERLVTYKMLELNRDTTLTARIGWTPEKTTAPLGPVAQCRSCELPRSVTIMGANGKCGHCLWTDYVSPMDREEQVNARVTKEDNETTPAVWVECHVKACRAQVSLLLNCYSVHRSREPQSCFKSPWTDKGILMAPEKALRLLVVIEISPNLPS
jgi:hypothetical protein